MVPLAQFFLSFFLYFFLKSFSPPQFWEWFKVWNQWTKWSHSKSITKIAKTVIWQFQRGRQEIKYNPQWETSNLKCSLLYKEKKLKLKIFLLTILAPNKGYPYVDTLMCIYSNKLIMVNFHIWNDIQAGWAM